MGGPPESLLARVGSIVIDREGAIYVADRKDQQVKVYDPNGRYIRAFGKVGQGPGEYQDLTWIFLTSRGGLGIHDFQRQIIHYYSLEGRYLSSHSVSRRPNTGGGRVLQLDGQDNFYSLTQVYDSRSATSWHEAARLNKDLTTDEILERLMFPTGPDWRERIERLIMRAHPAGGVVVGHPWEYAFRFYNVKGDLYKVVSRDFAPLPRTPEELEYQYKQSGFSRKFKNPFNDFTVDDRGWLIVRTTQRTLDRKEQFFDVFDEQGRYLAVMTLRTRDHLSDSWALTEPFSIHNGWIFFVGEDEEENLVILKCSADWPEASSAKNP